MYSEKGNRPGRGGRPPPQRGQPATSSPVAAHTRRNQKEKFAVYPGTKDDERTFLQGLIIQATDNSYGTATTRPIPSNRKLEMARSLLHESGEMEISQLRKKVAEDILRYQSRRIRKENEAEVIEYHKDLLRDEHQPSRYLDVAKYQEPSLMERLKKQQTDKEQESNVVEQSQGGVEEQKDSQSEDSYTEDQMEEAQRQLFPATLETSTTPPTTPSPPETNPFSHLGIPEPTVTMTRAQLQAFISEQVQLEVQKHEERRDAQAKKEQSQQEALAKSALNSLNKIKKEIASETDQAKNMTTALRSELASCQIIYKEWKANFQWLEAMETKLINLKNVAARTITETEDMAVTMARDLVTKELAAREAKLTSIKLGINKQAANIVKQHVTKLEESAHRIVKQNEMEYQTQHWSNLDSLTSESEKELRLLHEEIREARDQWTTAKVETGIGAKQVTTEQMETMQETINNMLTTHEQDQRAIDFITADVILLKEIVQNNSKANMDGDDRTKSEIPPVTPSFQRQPQNPKITNVFSVPKEQRQQTFEANERAAQMTADSNALQDRIRNNIRHFANQSIAHFPRDDRATAADIDAFYDQLVVVCKQYEIPIVARDDIREQGTRHPRTRNSDAGDSRTIPASAKGTNQTCPV